MIWLCVITLGPGSVLTYLLGRGVMQHMGWW